MPRDDRFRPKTKWKTTNKAWRLVLFGCTLLAVRAAEDAAYWRQLAKDDVSKYLDLRRNTNKAKNVILFIGDGLGLNTVMASRVLRGQLRNNTGEETVLEFEKLPHVGLSKVYSTDRQVPDSAASATALLSGVKTNSQIVGYDSTVTKDSCVTDKAEELTTMLDWSQTAGMATGIVTTTRITHATPAAAFAHVTNRNWEADVSVNWDAHMKGCKDIAHQLVKDNSNIQVIMGGGRENFLPHTTVDAGTGMPTNVRQDRLDLVEEWKEDKKSRGFPHEYVWNKGQFDRIDPNNTDYILGLFDASHMAFELDRDDSASGQPSLAEMTTKAIQVLKKNTNGFFLMVEGGRIDHAHHRNNAKRALYDTLAFDDAVKVAMDMTEENDTLIIVTADHSHVMTVAGYSDRGNDILGVANAGTDANGAGYTTLAYTNGPGYMYTSRSNLQSSETADDNYIQEATVPLSSETHSGEDVAIYSRGPMSHLLTGVKEQNTIAFVMAHAACVGDTGIPCDRGRNQQTEGVPSSTPKPCDTDVGTRQHSGGRIADSDNKSGNGCGGNTHHVTLMMTLLLLLLSFVTS